YNRKYKILFLTFFNRTNSSLLTTNGNGNYGYTLGTYRHNPTVNMYVPDTGDVISPSYNGVNYFVPERKFDGYSLSNIGVFNGFDIPKWYKTVELYSADVYDENVRRTLTYNIFNTEIHSHTIYSNSFLLYLPAGGFGQ